MVSAYRYVLQGIVDGEFDAVPIDILTIILDIAAECAERDSIDVDADGLFDAAAAHYTLLKRKGCHD